MYCIGDIETRGVYFFNYCPYILSNILLHDTVAT